jgi:hypothetical protein
LGFGVLTWFEGDEREVVEIVGMAVLVLVVGVRCKLEREG